MIKSIVDGKMEWTFTDSFEQSTLYQEMKETVVQDHAASFDVQGNDAENRNTTFQYQGTMELKDGTIVMTFESGAVMTQQDGPPVRDVKELADAGRVTLEKPDESELNTYTVKQGDSLHSIAEQYGISTKDLAIMKQTVIKYHFSGDDRCVERFLGVRLFRLVKEFKDTLGCGRHSLDHVADLGKLGNGLGKTFHILNK